MVATPQIRQMTVEEFDQYVLLPENKDRRLEYIAGRIVEVVSNSYCSIVAGLINRRVGRYLDDHGDFAWVTVPDGGFKVLGDRYMPDVGLILKAKHSSAPHETWVSVPLDLAVEVISPSDDEHDVRAKAFNYVRAGAVVWIVDPDKRVVQILAPDAAPRTLTVNDTLDGGTVLPGFTLLVKDIFPE